MMDKYHRTRSTLIEWQRSESLLKTIVGTMILLAPRIYAAIALASVAVWLLGLYAPENIFKIIGLIAIYYYTMAWFAPDNDSGVST